MSGDAAPSRVLFCAFAEVPGPTSAGQRTAQWLSVFGTKEMDALSLKGREAAHIQRLGGARMMRVPNTSGKPLLDKLSTYQRALQRQLQGEPYDLVWCADLFSASACAPLLKGTNTALFVEVAVVPSLSRALVAAAATGGGDESQIKKSWRDAERNAMRAAARVVLPSRQSAKLLSERVDPRMLLVVPRAVDRTVFTPPSVEVAIDDERLVLVFGGREGGGRSKSAVAIAQALAATLPASVRIGVLGMPGPADAELRAAIARLGLEDRVELTDADSNLAVNGALALAHVVVVPSCAEEDAEPFALPHRALEAMACGRAVVVSGPEGCFRDSATPGEHFVAAPAREPRRVADAVAALLDDDVTRSSLGRAAARHVERTADLMTRAQELHALVAEAVRIPLKVHAPRTDDPDTSSKSAPAAKVAPAAPPASGPPGPSPAGATAVAAPPAAVSSSGSGSGSGPVFAARRGAPRSGRGPERDALPGVLSVAQPLPTVRMEMPQLSGADGGGMWDGDTFLDGNLEGAPLAIDTSPDAARVRAAMLVSSDAQSKAGSLEEVSLPDHAAGDDGAAEGPSVVDAPVPAASDAPSQPSSPAVPTSLLVHAVVDSASGDPWGPDTIADGTPIESQQPRPEPSASSASSASSAEAPRPARAKKASFLVAAPDERSRTDLKSPLHPKNAPADRRKGAPVNDARITTKVAVLDDDSAASEPATTEDQPPTSSESSDDDLPPR